MPSEFVTHFTRSLDSPTSRAASPAPSPSPSFSNLNDSMSVATASPKKQTLHALLVSLNQGNITTDDIKHATVTLHTASTYESSANDHEEEVLQDAISAKLTVALYSETLDAFLDQAMQVEAEAEWWADIESSRTSVALYLLQTFPSRILNALRAIIQLLRENKVPITLSAFSPTAIQSLLPSNISSLRPGPITTAIFPHLKNEPSVSLAMLLPPRKPIQTENLAPSHFFLTPLRRVQSTASFALRLVNLPLELTRQECKYNRKALQKLRDERAEVVGRLAQLRAPMAELVRGQQLSTPPASTTSKRTGTEQAERGPSVHSTVLASLAEIILPHAVPNPSLLVPIQQLALWLPGLRQQHTRVLHQRRLLRPSVVARAWPGALVFPAIATYVYATRDEWVPALVGLLVDAKETVRGFVRGWLVEPLLGVLDTVRGGGKGDVLVHEEGVLADLESLERMSVDLARDALGYTPAQLAALSAQVRTGDLTPIMQLYEEDIRSPLRSALTGTLVRNMFIQVQKAKVDIDQALQGIDRLLKSQELTFAFVGVAPALGVVYLVGGALGRMWAAARGTGLGGRKRRRGVWEGLRRIERLLIMYPQSSASTTPSASPSISASTSGTSSHSSTSAPASASPPTIPDAPIAALPTGLLILSLTRLRAYALACLPPHIRAPFLEDLGDLEDTDLDREAKLRIVQRIWRCWGTGMGNDAVIRF